VGRGDGSWVGLEGGRHDALFQMLQQEVLEVVAPGGLHTHIHRHRVCVC
jgi:hypothetical protein